MTRCSEPPQKVQTTAICGIEGIGAPSAPAAENPRTTASSVISSTAARSAGARPLSW